MFLFSAILLGVTAGVVVFGIYELASSERIEESLRAHRSDSASNYAFDAVVVARSRFSEAVKAFELAVSHTSQLALSGRPQTPEHGDLMELEQAKDEARIQLLDSQRLWESVKPTGGPSSPADLWFGTGSLRGWMLGAVGYERAFIRLDHAVDPGCWAVWKISRFRFGLGLGVESQHLALLASGADIRQLANLISHGFDGSEIAFRPGFSPMRWYRRSTQPVWSRVASGILLDGTRGRATVMWGAGKAIRSRVGDAFEVELKTPLAEMGRMPIDDSVLTTATKGPALIAGAWTGRRPHPRLLTGSNHTTWRH
jgi:hypothetical protein